MFTSNLEESTQARLRLKLPRLAFGRGQCVSTLRPEETLEAKLAGAILKGHCLSGGLPEEGGITRGHPESARPESVPVLSRLSQIVCVEEGGMT